MWRTRPRQQSRGRRRWRRRVRSLLRFYATACSTRMCARETSMRVYLTIGIAVTILCMAVPARAQLDFTGQWAPLYHEDTIERIPGPALGDYTGLPLSEAGRMRAASADADRILGVQ